MTTSNEAYTRSNKAPPPPLPNKMVVLLMEARWILFAALSICLILVLISYSKADPGWSQSSVVPKIHNVGGKFGAWLADVLLYVFGFFFCFFFFFFFCLLVWYFYIGKKENKAKNKKKRGVFKKKKKRKDLVAC